jgi:hypothetical protein
MDIKHGIELLFDGGYEGSNRKLVHVPIFTKVVLEREFFEVCEPALVNDF